MLTTIVKLLKLYLYYGRVRKENVDAKWNILWKTWNNSNFCEVSVIFVNRNLILTSSEKYKNFELENIYICRHQIKHIVLKCYWKNLLKHNKNKAYVFKHKTYAKNVQMSVKTWNEKFGK